MNNLSMMNRNIIVALLTLVPLICMTSGNISAQDTSAKTMGKPVQFVSLDSTFPQPNAGSARDAEETLSGAMLSAKTFYDSGVKYLEKKNTTLPSRNLTKLWRSILCRQRHTTIVVLLMLKKAGMTLPSRTSQRP